MALYVFWLVYMYVSSHAAARVVWAWLIPFYFFFFSSCILLIPSGLVAVIQCIQCIPNKVFVQ